MKEMVSRKITKGKSDVSVKGMFKKAGIVKSVVLLSTLLLLGACGNELKNNESLKIMKV